MGFAREETWSCCGIFQDVNNRIAPSTSMGCALGGELSELGPIAESLACTLVVFVHVNHPPCLLRLSGFA